MCSAHQNPGTPGWTASILKSAESSLAEACDLAALHRNVEPAGRSDQSVDQCGQRIDLHLRDHGLVVAAVDQAGDVVLPFGQKGERLGSEAWIRDPAPGEREGASSLSTAKS